MLGQTVVQHLGTHTECNIGHQYHLVLFLADMGKSFKCCFKQVFLCFFSFKIDWHLRIQLFSLMPNSKNLSITVVFYSLFSTTSLMLSKLSTDLAFVVSPSHEGKAPSVGSVVNFKCRALLICTFQWSMALANTSQTI